MSFTLSLNKTLGQFLGDAINICTTTVTGTTGNVGLSFFVSQTSSKTLRRYRVNVPFNSSPDWKRLAPISSSGSFSGKNVWAVDILSVNNICTLRLVRTSVGNSPATSSLGIKIFAYAPTGETVSLQNSTSTYTNINTQVVYESAIVGLSSGNVGVNNDDPMHTLDVTGNLNIYENYKIRSNVILSDTTLGNSVIYSNLQRLGNVQNLVITGNVPGKYSLDVGGDINFTGNLLLGGNVYTGQPSDPRFMTYGTSTPFTYNGPGVSYDNPLSFFSILSSRGQEFLTFSDNIFTFSESGTFAVQVEVEGGYPWFPEGDITTYFLVNHTKIGVERHEGGSSFKCTKFVNVDVNTNDTLSFFIDSIVGNQYEATIQKCRIRFSKVEIRGVGVATVFDGTFGGPVNFTGLTQASTGNLLYINPTTGNLTYDINVDVAGNVSANTLSIHGNARVGNVSTNVLSATTITGILLSENQPNVTSVGTLVSLQINGNVTAGNLSTNTVTATNITGTLLSANQSNITTVGTLGFLEVSGVATAANVTATDVNVSGNLKVNGSIWASSVIYGTTTPFTYTGPGSTYSNGVPFFAQTSTNGTPFVTADNTSNSVFTFTKAGTYMLQAELETGYPWFPEGSLNTFYIKNSGEKLGNESHTSSNFSCTRPYLMTANVSDNIKFIVDSSSGNEYEVGIYASKLTMLKFF